MTPIIFDYRSTFNDKIEFICHPLHDIGSVTRFTNFTVYLYVNNVFKKRYRNIVAGGYFSLKQQVDVLFNNY